jgi:hypothetical protein
VIVRGICIPDRDCTLRLQREFRAALAKSATCRRQVFLEFYAGAGSVSHMGSRLGFGVISIDIVNGDHHDLTRPCVQRVLRGWVSSGCVRGAWLGTICSSWSRARRGPPGSAWGPIRSREFIYGLPDLSPADQGRIEVGNRTMLQSADFIRKCIDCRVPCILENSVASLLWSAPPLAKLRTHADYSEVSVDQCAFGAAWRKRTRLGAWGCLLEAFENKLCQGKRGICSFTTKEHIVLRGTSKVHKCLWTSLAQSYPNKFARAAARSLVSSADGLHFLRLRQLGGWCI